MSDVTCVNKSYTYFVSDMTGKNSKEAVRQIHS